MKKIIYFFLLLPFLAIGQTTPQEVARKTAKDFIEAIKQTNNLKQSFIDGFGVKTKEQIGALEVGDAILWKEIDMKKMYDYIKRKQSNKLNELSRDEITFKIPLFFESKMVSYFTVSVSEQLIGTVTSITNTAIDGCSYLLTYATVVIDGKTYIVDTNATYFMKILNLTINRIIDTTYYAVNNGIKSVNIDKTQIVEYLSKKLLEQFSVKQLEKLSDGSTVY